ncbi:unnamed protein product [Cladocopium goreaui]|uniref:Methylated-DNA--protein-cysteine methyltransferase n=1 Tax=Cladocopium goreaui TaxID=2562237 RepID=A0A9P1GCE7_9DINO|nr:unnamed protein product [Cladocopium goreaui]
MSAQFQRLKFGGRAVVITFKPREEQVLEDWLRQNEDGWASPLSSMVSPDRLGQLFPLLSTVQPYSARRLGPPLRPQAMELRRNSRARSAMVHCFVKEQRRPPFQRLSRTVVLESPSKTKPGDWLCRSVVYRAVLKTWQGNRSVRDVVLHALPGKSRVGKKRHCGTVRHKLRRDLFGTGATVDTTSGGTGVGQIIALKKNPYAPTVPCHRVVKADRSLGGYFGATSLEDEKMKTKVQLLESEGVQFQNAGAVAAESFWRFPKDVDLEAVELPPTKHRRTSDELAEGDVKPAEKGLVRLTSGTTVSNAMAM